MVSRLCILADLLSRGILVDDAMRLTVVCDVFCDLSGTLNCTDEDVVQF
jgi:hypothetical protein